MGPPGARSPLWDDIRLYISTASCVMKRFFSRVFSRPCWTSVVLIQKMRECAPAFPQSTTGRRSRAMNI